MLSMDSLSPIVNFDLLDPIIDIASKKSKCIASNSNLFFKYWKN